ncbi:uncharacterized protein LOC121864161 isoform X2 [Homarus americanus]|uniref:uncharacterized protein LOC121864161 isoform X2 n=1 Tax=Homarus americanus TaxID=6706 RepID=UPI001C452BB4|nr:uncharacterized protein LOC121864161 isoform X2 [Homarus americanus]
MLGLYPRENFDVSLCDVGKFGDMTSWITQGKSLLEEPTTCPIVGNYAGELPDAPGYCAQLYSDCETPQLMYYTVGDCRNTSNVYEHEDLPGPTSEAGPWLPPEQKVSTGAVLTIADDEGGRGRRQVNGGQFRVANARTTTISWLWGTTPDTTTSTTTSTTTTTTTTRSPSSQRSPWTHLPLPRPPPAHSESTSERNYDRFQPDPYSEFRSQPEPPRRGGYNPVDFWPSNPSRPQYPPENAAPELSVAPPQPPRDPSPTSDNSEVAGSGVPGRATWVPGAPPGFLSASTHQPHVSEPRNPVGDNRHPTPPAPHNPSYNYSPDVGTGRQPLEQSIHSQQPIKQEREYQCLGQWEEEGRLYALTYRRDIRIYECFVGVIKPQGVVFIKEAGSHCSRGIRPEVLGMKLHRKESCTVDSTPSQASPSSQRSSSSSRAPVTKPPWLRTTRSWKPITEAGQALVSCKVGDVCTTHHHPTLDTVSILPQRMRGKGRYPYKRWWNSNEERKFYRNTNTLRKNHPMKNLFNSISTVKERTRGNLFWYNKQLHHSFPRNKFDIKVKNSDFASQRLKRNAYDQEIMSDPDTLGYRVNDHVEDNDENTMSKFVKALEGNKSQLIKLVTQQPQAVINRYNTTGAKLINKVGLTEALQNTHDDADDQSDCKNCSADAMPLHDSWMDTAFTLKHKDTDNHEHMSSDARATPLYTDNIQPGISIEAPHIVPAHTSSVDESGGDYTSEAGTLYNTGGDITTTDNIHRRDTDHVTGADNSHHHDADHVTGADNSHHHDADHVTGADNSHHHDADHVTGADNSHHHDADHVTGADNSHHYDTDHVTGADNSHHHDADHVTGADNSHHYDTDHVTGADNSHHH